MLTIAPWNVASAADVNHSIRSEQLREGAESRAKSRLGYEDVQKPNEDEDRYRPLRDFGELISRLGETIRRIEAESRSGSELPHIPGLPAGNAPGAGSPTFLERVYGPAGPTVTSVRALLNYRLVTLGNPNLKAGNVSEAGDRIVAGIVTKEGSLVARYHIDKKTGVWKLAN